MVGRAASHAAPSSIPIRGSAKRKLGVAKISRRLMAPRNRSTRHNVQDTLGLRLSDPFHLPFSTQIGLEFGKHAEHVQERLPSCARGADRLFGRPECDTCRPATHGRCPEDLRSSAPADRPALPSKCHHVGETGAATPVPIVPARELPLTFSDRMTSQPARRNASSCIVTFCSSVDARA